MSSYTMLRPLLFRLSPETAHSLTLKSLHWAARSGVLPHLVAPVQKFPQRVMGLDFPNPVGLAAGLDKNGECLDGFAGLGFGFIEVGTVTPRPQPGNPQPRLFRLPAARAVVNRMGFNNVGVDALLENVRDNSFQGVLGINLGKNADTPLEKAVDDYLCGLRKVYAHADYVTVNLSSPNTPGLRKLQYGKDLARLLDALKHTQTSLDAEYGRYVPLVVKIAPDLNTAEVEQVTSILLELEIDGVIATNTTLSRAGVENLRHADEAGGLSGAPLFTRATEVVREIAAASGGKLPVIAAGGIMNAAQAVEKIEAGASLVQLYTGLIYRGPNLVGECAAEIFQARERLIKAETAQVRLEKFQ